MKKMLVALLFVSLIAPFAPAQTSAAPSLKPIEMADIIKWKRINSPSISNDGQWMAYRLSPAEGDSEIVIRRTNGDKEMRFPAGDAASFGTHAFSHDSKWIAFSVSPTFRESKRLRRERKPIQNKVALVNLETEKKTEFEKIRRFAFSGERSSWIALHRYGPDTPTAGPPAGGPPAGGSPVGAQNAQQSNRPTGSDFILHELSSGNELSIGNVSEFSFDKKGDWMVWIVDAQDRVGNGIQARNMMTGAIIPLDADKANYKGLNWTEKYDGLTSVKGVEDKGWEDKLYSIVAFSQIASGSPQKIVYDPRSDDTFPAGMTVSADRAPQWTEDMSAVTFGIREVKKKKADQRRPGAANAGERRPAETPTPAQDDQTEKPDLVLWHWRDSRLQSQQQVEEGRDKAFSYLAVYHVADKKFVRLADNSLRQVSLAPNHKHALGIDNSQYELMGNLDGRRYQDVYAIDPKTGARKSILKKARWTFGLSPDGSHLLYYEDGHFLTYEIATGKTFNLTRQIPAVFYNEEDDHNIIKPPTRAMGWTADSKYVLLSDNWDIWKVAAQSGQAVNLTSNGKKEKIRYNIRYRLDPEEKGVDFAKPVYIGAISQQTKKSGVFRLDPGAKSLQSLVWEDAGFGSLMKAKNADTFLYTRETVKEYPNYYVADAWLKNGKRITDANPQQKDFLWTAGSRLITYTSPAGQELQAAIYLPAGYEPGKSYPTIVYMYEKLTNNLNRYAQPTANGFNMSVYTSNGYAVLMPDIVFKVNDPGTASTGCILAALKAAIGTGIIDKDRVGIHGHSWGGYQTAFIVTQTSAFKAAIAGAPLTDMISMYNHIYWNTGGGNMAIFESSQGRFTGGPWEVQDAYIRNSPLYHAKNVTTPLIILHNDKDGAVDFTQGIEYYNTLRRMQKPVVMFQYKGENHGLRKPANQRDYTVRMREFFDHHLKGKPAPRWWIDGVPHLKMKDHLEERGEKPAPSDPLSDRN
ncbi:MAG: prolyl oligopeptidase family serine peptidase [Acidobacteriota bacterium]